jgi:hypothetical protein
MLGLWRDNIHLQVMLALAVALVASYAFSPTHTHTTAAQPQHVDETQGGMLLTVPSACGWAGACV